MGKTVSTTISKECIHSDIASDKDNITVITNSHKRRKETLGNGKYQFTFQTSLDTNYWPSKGLWNADAPCVCSQKHTHAFDTFNNILGKEPAL